MIVSRTSGKFFHNLLIFGMGLLPHGVMADTPSIQSSNLSLQNSLIHSGNSGKISAEGHFTHSDILGGEYNNIGVSANGVSVSASNIRHTAATFQDSGTSSINGMSVSTQNSGSITASGTFDGNHIQGGHNSMAVQASGSAVTLSNIKQ